MKSELSENDLKLLMGDSNPDFATFLYARSDNLYKGINWIAMSVPMQWLAYRKMIPEAFLFILFSWALTLLLQFIFGMRASGNIAGFSRIISAILLGFCANAIYMKKLKRIFARSKSVPRDLKLSYIKSKGGVSDFLGYFFIVVELASFFLLSFIEVFVFQF